MDAVSGLAGPLLTVWIMAVGFVYMIRGSRGAKAAMSWPLTAAVRLVGKMLVTIGRAIGG